MPLEFRRSWGDEEVERFRDSWIRFVESEMQPHDAEARRRGHVGFELWERAGELGFLCVDIPEQWGGAGGDFRHEAVLHEEMARRALSGMSIGVHSIAAHYLLNHGTDDQKRRFLPRLAKGELVGAIAMTEPGAGSDLQAIRTCAERRSRPFLSCRAFQSRFPGLGLDPEARVGLIVWCLDCRHQVEPDPTAKAQRIMCRMCAIGSW